MIKVAVKEPDEPVEFKKINNSLEELQNIVGGYIECVQAGSGVIIICNEGGLIHGLKKNVFGFVGTIIFVSQSGSHFSSLNKKQEEFVRCILK